MKQSRYYTILFTVVVSASVFTITSLFAYVILTEPSAQQMFVEKTTNAVANAILILIELLVNNRDFIIF